MTYIGCNAVSIVRTPHSVSHMGGFLEANVSAATEDNNIVDTQRILNIAIGMLNQPACMFFMKIPLPLTASGAEMNNSTLSTSDSNSTTHPTYDEGAAPSHRDAAGKPNDATINASATLAKTLAD